MAPPAITAASPDAGGVQLAGTAPPRAPVRLATPHGAALSTTADGQGRWRVQLPASDQVRIFGLSARSDGRPVQAEGYVLVGPRGETALLRAGTGALRLDRPPGPRIAALDFDGEGGALLSGWAQAGTDVALRLDGRASAEVRADEAGRFIFSMPRISAGPHRVEATGVAFTDTLAFDASPPAPLVAGPLRSQVTGEGLRADWLTPGGGIQSTILAG